MSSLAGRRYRLGIVVSLFASLCLMPAGPASRAAPRASDLQAARDRLLELERDFQLVSEEYNLVHDNLVAIQARMGATELSIHRLERRMGTREDAAVSAAVELYKTGKAGAVEAVLTARSLSELESRLDYLRATNAAQTAALQRLTRYRRVLEQKFAELEAARAEALAAENTLTSLRATIESKVAGQRDEIAALNAAIARAERAAARREAAPVAPAPARVAAAPAPNARAQVAVDAALSRVGKPYQWGGAGPDSFDCSGLMMWSWGQAGVSLPHNSGAQYAATARVDSSDWQPGDLLFFGSPIHHVGLYIGGGRMVEAPYSGNTVRVNSAYRSDYAGAGRPGV